MSLLFKMTGTVLYFVFWKLESVSNFEFRIEVLRLLSVSLVDDPYEFFLLLGR